MILLIEEVGRLKLNLWIFWYVEIIELKPLQCLAELVEAWVV